MYMKEYLFLFRGGDGSTLQKNSEAWQAHMQKWMEWMRGLAEQNVLIGAQPLDTSGRQITGNKKIITDGPFMEGKEMVGGYLMCKAASYEDAVEIAKNCPILEFTDGIVEIRQIQELKM
jgi:hypothetical protein